MEFVAEDTADLTIVTVAGRLDLSRRRNSVDVWRNCGKTAGRRCSSSSLA